VELGQRFCLFSVTHEAVEWATDRGFRNVQVAEEAVIDLPGLEFKGKEWQTTRSALNRGVKDGVQYVEGALAQMPRGVLSQVRTISEVWVGDKGLPEMGFTLGGIDEALDPEVHCGLAIDTEGRVHGITSWLPSYGADGEVTGWTLDVMRRLPDGFKPVTEFLIASACLSFRDSGAQWVSLSGAPLAHSGEGEMGGLTRLLDRLGQILEPLYGFRSLDAFKAKFQPRHVPMFMVFRDEAALPRISLALTEAYLPDASTADLAKAGVDALIGAGAD
jgi:phosphatidylglycerol lysyltransferase